jgi:fatty acid amide hydrolase
VASVSPPSAACLTSYSAVELAAKVRAGDASAREVVQAHIDRIQAVDGQLNAVILRRFDEALHEADAVDRDRARGRFLGPLAGVPVTIKECFHVAGLPSTLGVERFRNAIAAQNGPLVARLRHAGAIVLGKTNVPQLMVLYESVNPLYGRSLHPLSPDRSPGGSSGGEGAIIAAHGSPLGLGSDLGGSIRQPAHACGICGLKPTTGRLTTQGALLNLNGMEAVGVQPGPMARTVADLALAMEVLVAPTGDRSDPVLPPLPDRDLREVDGRALRFGYFEDDGYFAPSPAIRRAVREAADALQQAGVAVRPFQVPDIQEAMRIYFGLIAADGGADFRRMLGSSHCDDQVAELLRLGSIPNFLRRPVAWWLDRRGHRSQAEMFRAIRTASADEYWQLVHRRNQYSQRFYHALDSAEIDVLLFPAFALPALRHGTSTRLTQAGSYCMLPNLLGIPAGVVPWTTVRADEETDRAETRDEAQTLARKAEHQSAGLPIGIQLAARPWREAEVLSAMQLVESLRSLAL